MDTNLFCTLTIRNHQIPESLGYASFCGNTSYRDLYIAWSEVLVSQLCPTLCELMDCSAPGFLVLHHLLELAQIHAQWLVSDAIQPSHPLSTLSPLPSIFPSIRVFSNDWPKYWSFSFSISPSNEYSWLISFRMDWSDLLAVQGTSMSLLQYHISKASVLQHSTFFMVQLAHPYMTIGKNKCLTWVWADF